MLSCSIIIPNYNHSPYLPERFESLLYQENLNAEFIILDDASNDNSVEIINKYLPRLNDKKVVFNKVNSGSTYCQWNLGVSNAKNNFIHIAESDDSALAGLLINLCKLLESDNDIVLSFCKSNIIDAESKDNGTWQYDDPIFDTDFIMDGTVFIEKYLIHNNVIPNASSVVFRKDVYLKVGLADTDLKTNGDWLVWLKLLCHGKVAYCSVPLNNFRKHEKSVTAVNNQKSLYHYHDIYAQPLRIRFRNYLKTVSKKKLNHIKNLNEDYISYDFGYRSLNLLKNKKYFQSIYVLIQSLFTGSIKTYFLKKYLLDFSNYLFKK
jgi:glycosyltransferase involved in cell wall biosynthesis